MEPQYWHTRWKKDRIYFLLDAISVWPFVYGILPASMNAPDLENIRYIPNDLKLDDY
jgi:hypothetical protein